MVDFNKLRKREPMTHEDKFKNTRLDSEVQMKWVNALATPSKELTEWEIGFVRKMRVKIIQGVFPLTDKELDKLEEIYTEKTS